MGGVGGEDAVDLWEMVEEKVEEGFVEFFTFADAMGHDQGCVAMLRLRIRERDVLFDRETEMIGGLVADAT